jgi:hypothetical protein
MLEVVNRAGGRCKVKDVIDMARIERMRDILVSKLKSSFTGKVFDVLHSAGQEVVGAHNRVIFS